MFTSSHVVGVLVRVAHYRHHRHAVALLCGDGRQAPVRRVHDPGGLLGAHAALEPEVVVRPSAAGRRRTVGVADGLGVELRPLLRAQPFAPGQLLRTLHRGGGGVRPCPLQVGVAPRRAERPRVLGLRRDRRQRQQRQTGDRRDEPPELFLPHRSPPFRRNAGRGIIPADMQASDASCPRGSCGSSRPSRRSTSASARTGSGPSRTRCPSWP